jgi:hypothetical protein
MNRDRVYIMKETRKNLRKRKISRQNAPNDAGQHLVDAYKQFFSYTYPPADGGNRTYFDRESPSRMIRTVVTYSVGERPLIHFADA